MHWAGVGLGGLLLQLRLREVELLVRGLFARPPQEPDEELPDVEIASAERRAALQREALRRAKRGQV